MLQANKAKNYAHKVSKQKIGWRKKPVIESLQESGRETADAIISITDALTLVFENQRLLAEIAGKLFGLGTVSFDTNRYVVNRLKLASENERLCELGKAEISKVIEQLEERAEQLEEHDEVLKNMRNTMKQLEDHGTALRKIEKNENVLYKRLFIFVTTVSVVLSVVALFFAVLK